MIVVFSKCSNFNMLFAFRNSTLHKIMKIFKLNRRFVATSKMVSVRVLVIVIEDLCTL